MYRHLNTNKSPNQEILLSSAIRCVCESFQGPQLTGVPILSCRLVKSPPFHIPEAWKRNPFGRSFPAKAIIVPTGGHEDTYFFAIFCWRPVYFYKVWRLAVIESRRLRMEWRIDLNHDTRHLCTGKQKIKLANARNRDRLCFFRTKRRFNSHAKCTDWVSTELTSLLLAVRTSTVVTALKK